MMKSTTNWRSVLVAAAVVTAAGSFLEIPAVAQGPGGRGRGGEGQGERERGERGPGGWGQRRGGEGRPGGPGGERGGRRGGGRDRENRENGGNDRPAETKAAAPAATATSSANSFGTTSDTERFRKQATDLIQLHDKNNNKFLDGEEVEKLGMSKAADTDHDGTITHNDLVAYYSGAAKGAAATKPATSESATVAKSASTQPAKSDQGDGKNDRVIVNKTRKSYRFKSTKDRIDNWKFSSRDANGDGQVSMSEYSRSWSERTASEFLRYDKDNDGMITAAEAP
jgi:hypothetical protein